MSVASLLLRVMLMISLLLNGLNAAMAGEHRMDAPETAPAAAPPCHGHAAAHSGLQPPHANDHQTQAVPDDAHCKLKDCVRTCAQQPALAAEGLALFAADYAGTRPLQQHAPGHPTPALPRIQRPPIG
ncbi:CopL family metal-binding regulatory protein [Stenotrophomonas pennii]|uniref:CopL family metal-binding regulatory protein n=1 Tax=Stenotrophomonas lacuserhaii TaxID=2760084 RepID=UPI0032097DDE